MTFFADNAEGKGFINDLILTISINERNNATHFLKLFLCEIRKCDIKAVGSFDDCKRSTWSEFLTSLFI